MMNQRDYERMKRQIREEYERKMDALEMVWLMAKPVPKSRLDAEKPRQTQGPVPEESLIPLERTPVESNGNHELKRGDLQRAVQAVIPDMPRMFTPHHVKRSIEKRFPEMGEIRGASLSSALKRLAEVSQDFELNLTGSGRRPTRYQRKDGAVKQAS
jgi:hypothetical protein